MRGWKKHEVEDEDSGPKSAPGMCMCYGCPMLGSISNSTGRSDDWMCASHVRAEPSDWHEITLRLNNHLGLIVSLAKDLRRAQNGHDIDMRHWMVALKTSGFEDYLPNDADRRPNGELSMRKWQTRVEKQLADAANSNLQATTADSQSRPIRDVVDSVMVRVDEWLKKHHLKEAA